MTSALDMGVVPDIMAYWRSRGMASVGIDGNPHTQELSSLLLSQYPCEVGDITEYMEMEQGEQPFDLVTCLDVLPYIPSMYADIVWTNLTRLCAKCLIFSLKEMDKIEKNTSRFSFFFLCGKSIAVLWLCEKCGFDQLFKAKHRKYSFENFFVCF